MQIMQSDKYIGLLFEQNTWFNLINMDGREHPKNLEPTWFGHSIGKWDGDTLVVDTDRLQRLDAARHDRPSAQRRAAHDSDVPAHRRRPHRVHGDD